MSKGAGPIGEFELMAYVDGQLAPAQRLEVEEYLASHPDLAAQIMGDMRARDALRLAAERPMAPASNQTLEAFARLQRGLSWQRGFQLAVRGAALSALIVVGWTANTVLPDANPPTISLPSIVDDAVEAHRTALIRSKLPSQIENVPADTKELRDAAQVSLPKLPRGWRLRDVQLFPSDDGPGVQMTIDPPGKGADFSLFAVRTGDAVPAKPVLIDRGVDEVAYWRRGDTAYAVTGAEADPIDRIAADLADEPAL